MPLKSTLDEIFNKVSSVVYAKRRYNTIPSFQQYKKILTIIGELKKFDKPKKKNRLKK